MDDIQASSGTQDTEVVYDKKEQVEKISRFIRPYEQLRAVFDMKGGGTGFVAITDKRLVFYDKAFLGRRKAIVSIPFSKITRVASEDDSGTFFSPKLFTTSRLIVCAGSECYEFEFRGADKAHLAYELIIDGLL